MVALNALLRMQSVSRAADSANITQPAMSAALARLRQYFGDPLLITKNGRSTLSPLAQALSTPVSEMLRSIDESIIAQPLFDPAVSDREFRLLAADTVIAGLLAKPLQYISQIAPHLRLDITTPHGDITEKLDRGQVDLIIAPEAFCSSCHPQELLLEEDHCVIACAKNYGSEHLTLDQYAAADHVEVLIGPTREPYLPEYLFSTLGITRRIGVKLDNFSLVPFFLTGTTRLATFPGMTAELYRCFADLKLLDLPFELPGVRVVMQWHSRANRDPGLAWLRTRIQQHLPASHQEYRSRLYRLALETI
ncbi:LysR family transcriptional regulator [Ensifer aridi]|uniref:LysR family transcriptional regulator n=1 Tax=Ensifer aridi TaxID=1708715 RepID=UPI0015E3AF18|nr:LysR family transcriptional regulator [Ensifer aridi]